MSDKYIPGGSKIEITAPNGALFHVPDSFAERMLRKEVQLSKADD